MKKICFFSGDMNRSGGTERVSTVIANELVARGYEVYFLSLEYGKDPFFHIDSRIHMASLEMERKSKKINFFRIIKDLRTFIKINDIEYIVGIDVISSIFTIPATFKLETKVIAWEHFNYFAKVGNKLQNFERSFGRWLSCKFGQVVVTLTEEDCVAYREHIKCSANVIKIFNPVTIQRAVSSNLNTKNVIAVGRLVPQKGFDLLLKAWKVVKKNDTEWSLTIIGSGEEEAKLLYLAEELKISNSVNFIPNTKNVMKHYLNSSIYALSSRYEGFGLVLVEAKTFGLPIVSFSCKSGPSEIINDKIDGFLVEEENYQEMAKKLLKLMNDKDLRIRMGKEAFQENRFDLVKIIEQWEKLFII